MPTRPLLAIASLACLLAVAVPQLAAQDYTLTFLKEEFKEEAPENGQARINHTWYVISEFGEKVTAPTLLPGPDVPWADVGLVGERL